MNQEQWGFTLYYKNPFRWTLQTISVIVAPVVPVLPMRSATHIIPCACDHTYLRILGMLVMGVSSEAANQGCPVFDTVKSGEDLMPLPGLEGYRGLKGHQKRQYSETTLGIITITWHLDLQAVHHPEFSGCIGRMSSSGPV